MSARDRLVAALTTLGEEHGLDGNKFYAAEVATAAGAPVMTVYQWGRRLVPLAFKHDGAEIEVRYDRGRFVLERAS